MKQRGVNRVVMAHWDFEAAKEFYEQVLGATFEKENDDGEAAQFGVRVAMSWNAGIELVSPLEGVDGPIRSMLEERGEGLAGVVFAVDDCDASMDAAQEHGLSSYYFLDYSQEQIDKKCAGKFSQYKEHFLATAPPLNSTTLLGEFQVKA
jgi:predicted enzyme related to lactoylglutathione lyase